MINKEAVLEIISDYKKNFERIHKEEIYKWKAVKWFQDNWNESAEDFSSMLEVALAKAGNLLAAQNYFPKGMICDIAKKDPEAVKAMFIALFDEFQPIIERVENFIDNAERLRIKYGSNAWKSHYQTLNSVSVYLFFRYPDKYYIFKYQKYKNTAQKVGYSHIPKKGQIEELQNYYNLCNKILELVKEDAELLQLNEKRLTSEDYDDKESHILTEDIVYFGSKINITSIGNGWWPTEEEYLPGIDKDQWLNLLLNNKIFNKNSLVIMKRMLDIGGEATCVQLSQKYGETPNFYNRGSSALAERIQKETNCDVLDRDNENSRYWIILYIGKKADKNIDGNYIWRLRPELKAALEEFDFSGIEQDSNNKNNYWWLNASPKIWSFSDIRFGEEVNYTLLNENGNKRRIYQNFLDAKAGDIVIGYEANPNKQIVAICKISRENDGKNIYFEKTENLLNPVDYNTIKEAPELKEMEFIKNPNGSLFKLTKDEYEIILDIIREQNPLNITQEKYVPYTKQNFLHEVYLPEEQYDSLVSLLEYKKNIILQGAPGVGKTFIAERLAYSILGKKDTDKIKYIQFHQNYSYEDFVMGYKPDGIGGFKLEKGIFYQFCKKAENNPDEKYFFIIDEINRGNLSKIFGELLMMIEKDYRNKKVTLAYDKDIQFIVPDNLYLIGMMNTADRSLAMIDYALRRRFSFYDMRPAYNNENFKKYIKSLNSEILNDIIDFIDNELNQEIAKDASLGDGFCIGHSYFCNQVNFTEEWLSAIVEYDLIPTLKEYWFDDLIKFQKWADKLRGILND